MMMGLALGALLAAAAPPPSPAAALAPDLRARLKAATLVPVKKVGDLPEPVKEAFRAVTGEPTLAMAEPDAPFQATDDIAEPGLPWRRLDLAGVAGDLCLVHYERGGFAHTYNVVLFTIADGKARFAWGGLVHDRVTDLAALKALVLEGKVDTHSSYW